MDTPEASLYRHLDVEEDSIRDLLEKWIDGMDEYQAVFDPIHDQEVVTGSLTDDLVDIYLDLRRGLSLLDNDSDIKEAVWWWKLSYWTHSGRHLHNALLVLHSLGVGGIPRRLT